MNQLFVARKKDVVNLKYALGSSQVERSQGNQGTLQFFKVAFSTFWFKFGATLRRQAERRDSGTRQKASNLAQPVP